jgi:cyclo(L-tyrosyl-L-tyrosyl) synthase
MSGPNHNLTITPLTENCIASFEAREHICIGISPFNSLFSEQYIGSLVKWSLEHFKSFHLFIPDEPTFYTLQALGYSELECRRKMKKQLNWLRNKLNKALEANGVNKTAQHILDWEILSKNKIFREQLDEVYALFDADQAFRDECVRASRWVLQNKMDEKDITDKILLKAVKYFLSEIPLFAATNEIVGTRTSLFCYHQSIAFHEALYQGKLTLRSATGQGYGKINS